MRVPVSTYRLQIRESFDLHAAANIAGYVHALGVDWLYLSPILTAERGSDHGYDVVDHSRIDPARGGREGLDAASAAARALGLGVLIDIVPNHMGVATPKQNLWWWDLLTHGRDSRYAEAFDVDWAFGRGKVRIPVLGDEPDPVFEIIDGELAYFDNRFPLAPGTADDGASPEEVHSRQNYELINWRRADTELNYRRFFAVNSLAGIRVETPWVFEESHAEIIRWITDGLADGLRVDHPDGLADPARYLDALAAATKGAYVLVEKILESDEQLPTAWAASGTTGYDALADVDRVLVDPAGQTALDTLDSALRDSTEAVSWTHLIHSTKRAVADGILRSEVLRIERDLGASLPQPGDSTADAIAELLACFPVYRSYLPLGIEHLHEAVKSAKEHRPDVSARIDALLPTLSDPSHPAAIRFQQTSGMVMAKGVEDTAFYRYTRLGSLTEVGADPSEFSIGIDEFHRRQQLRQASFPSSLTTLSTHDTKRGEDVRARISVLAEIPEEWSAALHQLHEAAPLGDGPLESLLWEAIIGAWPASRERLHAYAEKAAREAGNSTAWTAPSDQFETRMHALIDSAFDDEHVAGILEHLLDTVRQPGWSNSLSAKVIQLTAPGVPDVYQGSELWETSLVDPDNRRPVDFDARQLYLAAIDAGAQPPIDDSGAVKLLVTARSLRLRRDHPGLFTRYAAIAAYGSAATHVIAFDRGGALTVATRLPIGLARNGGWGDTSLIVPGRRVTDVFTGRIFDSNTLLLSELLARYPVALLVPSDEAHNDR
ncbi:malto-oligosyltrehalose synthase [Frigoribacterium sp. CG_9.8]|uniref:malto-oligosyltrehalose synthase n=1 Tax=Frigoribacterium sp. CG_9.8 TaxID=2787733 RepID=UPI0018CB7708|nr:malto-oligosyltrehalose synthase [Frigoribacterium sp. CG_9.8]MBG6107143.1 (1->4)-alpha-D-glucan 1-alpha-D-glucosylmutase [Frigoribacterium sp. CG_9.8]